VIEVNIRHQGKVDTRGKATENISRLEIRDGEAQQLTADLFQASDSGKGLFQLMGRTRNGQWLFPHGLHADGGTATYPDPTDRYGSGFSLICHRVFTRVHRLSAAELSCRNNPYSWFGSNDTVPAVAPIPWYP
jgi:hypothetical protein